MNFAAEARVSGDDALGNITEKTVGGVVTKMEYPAVAGLKFLVV